jgi:hypothetical protein
MCCKGFLKKKIGCYLSNFFIIFERKNKTNASYVLIRNKALFLTLAGTKTNYICKEG